MWRLQPWNGLTRWFAGRRNRATLSELGRRLQVSLDLGESAMAHRQARLDELLFFAPDCLTKEMLYSFYFSSEELLANIDASLTVISRDLLYSRITGGTCALVTSKGFLSRQGRKMILQRLPVLPGPFVRRVRRRLRYIAWDTAQMQEDTIRLEQVLQLLRDKGCILNPPPSSFYRPVDLDRVFDLYVEHRRSPVFAQRILEALDVVKVTYVKAAPQPIPSMAATKAAARLKRTLYDYVDLQIGALAPEWRRDLVETLVAEGVSPDEAKILIVRCGDLLKHAEYADVRPLLFPQPELHERARAHPLYGDLEIGPDGVIFSTHRAVDSAESPAADPPDGASDTRTDQTGDDHGEHPQRA